MKPTNITFLFCFVALITGGSISKSEYVVEWFHPGDNTAKHLMITIDEKNNELTFEVVSRSDTVPTCQNPPNCPPPENFGRIESASKGDFYELSNWNTAEKVNKLGVVMITIEKK